MADSGEAVAEVGVCVEVGVADVVVADVVEVGVEVAVAEIVAVIVAWRRRVKLKDGGVGGGDATVTAVADWHQLRNAL